MLAWLGLFMFFALLFRHIHESKNRKFERELKLQSIQRRKAALKAKEKAKTESE